MAAAAEAKAVELAGEYEYSPNNGRQLVPILIEVTIMSPVEKGVQSPCEKVIEWRTNQPECGAEEAQQLQTILQEGITNEDQAALLSNACNASGMREVCEHADEC
jgi:hypothetical protein